MGTKGAGKEHPWACQAGGTATKRGFPGRKASLLFPKVCRVEQWQRSQLDVMPYPLGPAPGLHPCQQDPSGGLPYLPRCLRALHLQRPAIKEQQMARNLWGKRKKKKKKGFIGICKDKLINSFNEGSKPQSLPRVWPWEDRSPLLRVLLWCPCKLAQHEAMSKEQMTSALPSQSFQNAHLTMVRAPLGDGNHRADSQNSQEDKNSPIPLIPSLCSAMSAPADAAGAHVHHTKALQLIDLVPKGLDGHLRLPLRYRAACLEETTDRFSLARPNRWSGQTDTPVGNEPRCSLARVQPAPRARILHWILLPVHPCNHTCYYHVSVPNRPDAPEPSDRQT